MAFLQLILMFFIFTTPSLSCPQYQREALLHFKSLLLSNSTHNHSISNESLLGFGSLESWDGANSSDCCQWNRVICHSSSQQVISLDLSSLSYDLHSDLLAPIFHIQSLTWLDISNNWMQDAFPGDRFANLTKLVHLNASLNRFTASTFPPQLFRLRHLELLDISFNSIEGSLERDLGNLVNLKVLKLDGNDMEKQVPKEIGNLTELTELTLYGNKFSGPILSSISSLRNLSVLDLSFNSFSGQIPIEIGNLLHLSSLALSGNFFTGGIPSSIQKLVKLQVLWLDNNLLHGDIPSWLFDFKEMKHLWLGKNNLTWDNKAVIVPKCKLSSLSLAYCNVSRKFPALLSSQTNLSSLDLSGNHLEENFPQWLLQPSLVRLTLSDNKLRGTLPPRLFRSKHLAYLDLSKNDFSGQLPNTIGEATSLRNLMLSDNKFSGVLPKSIVNLAGLSLLDLSRNGFSGKFPNFSSESSIMCLYISSNQFSGEVPTILGKNLMILDASQNEFTGGFLLKLANFSRLIIHLDLHDNHINGKIPPLSSVLYVLQVLNLRNNSFEGRVPDDLSSSQSLRILDLSHNNLSDKIPQALGNMAGMTDKSDPSLSMYGMLASYPPEIIDLLVFPSLEISWKKSQHALFSRTLKFYCFIDLSNNQLSGEIPVTFGNLTGLKSLNLSHNNLFGEIPRSFGCLESIESLDLSHNIISGGIPTTLAKLEQLNVLDLSDNRLTGPIPDGPQMDRLNDPSYYANNSGVCGFQIQIPCREETMSPPDEESQEGKRDETWSWREFAGLGFPVGFFTTLLFMFGIGFFHVKPRRRVFFV